jgi:hypothetical protein
MSDKPERAGWLYAGRFCSICSSEVTEDDWLLVDPDGELVDESWVDRTVIRHYGTCPEAEA